MVDGYNKMAARTIATSGKRGASYGVEKVSWPCGKCNFKNRSNDDKCKRCRSKRPIQTAADKVAETALITKPQRNHGWKEVLDPTTQQLYYWKESTNETAWDRPAAMGPAPAGTGWFGRGKGGSTKGNRLEEADAKYRARAAFQQIEEIDQSKTSRLEGTNEYNIWYGKFLGEHWRREGPGGKQAAETRCVVERDAGYTAGDRATQGQTFFCLFFGRGCCGRGQNCQFIHRIPLAVDEGRADTMHDVFGRERHATHRDDMGGVGCFQKNSRTLYVGQLKTTPYEESEGGGGEKALKKVVTKHFGEFGEIEKVNVIWRLSIAFVRFRFRLNSEFAKESMAGQSLEHGEILNIRWAYDDPNPMVQKAIQRANEDAMMAAMAAQERALALKNQGGGGSSSSSSPVAPSRQGKKAMTGYFSPEMSFAMHMTARKHGMSLQDAMAEAFNDWLRKMGESPVGK